MCLFAGSGSIAALNELRAKLIGARPLTLAGALLGIVGTCTPMAIAQTTPNVIGERAPSYTGDAFENVNLPVRPRAGVIEFGAARAWSWRIGTTRRLLLDRDVEITLGPFSFVADRASVWLEPIAIVNEEGERRAAHQVAVYFDRVRTPGGTPGLVQSGERLLVTGVLVGPGPELRTDRLFERTAPTSDFLRDARARFGRHLDRVTGRPVGGSPDQTRFELPTRAGEEPVRIALGDLRRAGDVRNVDADSPLGIVEGEPGVAFLAPAGEGADRQPERLVDTRDAVPEYERREPVAPARRRLVWNTASSQGVSQGDERLIVLTGGRIALSVTPANPLREAALQLSAERAVVFMEEGSETTDLRGMVSNVGDVAGVYLEGGVVATDGRYTLRGEQVFYDPKTDEAIVLDAVFSAIDPERSVPLYARASEVRQLSLTEWTAHDATLANVAFAEPHFSIGATDVTIRLTEGTGEGGVGGFGAGDGTGGLIVGARGVPYVEADGVSFNVGDTPVIGAPSLSGSIEQPAITDLRYENVAGDNAIRTRWDLFVLGGLERREGTSAELLIDGFIERGPALGLDASWNRPGISGGIYAYGIYDSGTDELSSGAEIDRDNDFRGVVLSENAWRVNDDWTLFFETSFISDEAFIDVFFDNESATRREFTNSLYARRLRKNELIGLEVRGSVNDFIPNEDLLQSQGYQTERLPEARYARTAQDLGALSYTADARLGYVRFNFHQPKLREIGLDTNERARNAFGLTPGDRLSDVLNAQGLDQGNVARFDTRHELELPMRMGEINLVPFVTGRFTIYDDGFDEFRGAGDRDEEDFRLWSSAGVRASTSIVKTDTSVRSELFDLNGVRHIIEPSVTAWQGASTIDQRLLPVYDPEVESLADGTVVRAGARQTWQTKRGGAYGERGEYVTDWIVLETNYVWSSEDAPVESPLGFFYESRPERSNLGEFFQGDVSMRLTDAISVSGDLVHDFENARTARVAAGLAIDHGYGYSSFVQYRSLEGFDAQRLRAGARYELTRKYAAEVATVWDLDRDEFQRFSIDLSRRFPQWTISVGFDVDNISDNFSVGVTARPVGFGSERRRRLYTDDHTPLLPDRSPSSLRTTSAIGGPFGD